MAYQSKTWSLSDEVVAEIERRVQEMKARTGSGSPNRVLLELLATAYQAAKENGEQALKTDFIIRDEHQRAHLDATGPELSSGKGKATVETRGIRPKGGTKR